MYLTRAVSAAAMTFTGVGAFMNNRDALRIHSFVSLALFVLSVHDCVLVSSDVCHCPSHMLLQAFAALWDKLPLR